MIFSSALIIGKLVSIRGFIAKYWKQIALGSLIFLVLHQNFMTFEMLKWVGIRTVPGLIEKHDEQIQEYIIALQLCEEGRVKLKDAIEERNAEILVWAEKTEELQADHDKLTGRLEEMQRIADKKVEEILNAPNPVGCESAMDYLRSSGGSRW